MHLVGLSVLLYLIDDARSNKNQAVVSLSSLRALLLTVFVSYVLLSSYVYSLYLMCIRCTMCVLLFYFRCRTAGQKSVSGRSCDRPPRHRFFLVSLCLQANAEMVPQFPSCYYMPLMQPSRLKFPSYFFFIYISVHVK